VFGDAMTVLPGPDRAALRVGTRFIFWIPPQEFRVSYFDDGSPGAVVALRWSSHAYTSSGRQRCSRGPMRSAGGAQPFASHLSMVRSVT
jgi:hypothetical protein